MTHDIANRDLLIGMLADRYDISSEFGALDECTADGPFDLCIVDAVELTRSCDTLRRIRCERQPPILPILLLAGRGGIGVAAHKLADIVDDVLVCPLDPLEAGVRVRSLLVTRRLSVRLERLAGRLQSEQRIVQRLQAASLPRALPEFAGLRFDAVYRSASDDVNIGGDWYDAMRLPDGRMVLSVGDVCGSGLDASVTMATCRQVLRGIAYVRADPTMMLEVVDRTLRANSPDRFVTAFVGVFDPITSELRYASAGHPPALLRLPDGSIRELATDGVPLGIALRSSWLTSLIRVPDGSLLVLYTDGLTEAERDVCAAAERLTDIVKRSEVAVAGDAALAIYEMMLSQNPNDDVAVAVLRVGSSDRPLPVRRWRFNALSGEDAGATRQAISQLLEAHGLSSGSIISAELVLAELLGNVVRHSGGEVEIALDLAGVSPVLSVMDRGEGFRHGPRLPADLLHESGRGLYIVSTLAEEFSVDRRSDGGSHARVILPSAARGAAAPETLFT